MRRMLKWLGVSLAVLLVSVLLLVSPAIYVEAFCHAPVSDDGYRPLIHDPARQRREANTYLTYPEWHIVYAYDGMAETLKTGDEFQMDTWSAIRDFWVADCALTRIADAHGGADADTRAMVATIGVSFTLEMGLKAAYEETVGRAAAWWRGNEKTPQDLIARDMAIDYAAFLRQIPWYKYPFQAALDNLAASKADGSLRGYERKLALGTEWRAKIAYAGAIAAAVEATGEAQLTISSVVSGLNEEALARISDTRIIAVTPDGALIETPRYDRFTHILQDIAKAGGTIREIAGNDDIMVSFTIPEGAKEGDLPQGNQIARLKRTSFASERLLLSVKVTDLADLLRRWPLGDPGVEHVFDY